MASYRKWKVLTMPRKRVDVQMYSEKSTYANPMRSSIEKCNEYKVGIAFVFIDF